MHFSTGFHKIAFIAPVLGAIGRGVARGALKAGATAGKATAKTLGATSRVVGGPINLGFMALDAGSQMKDNLRALQSTYR